MAKKLMALLLAVLMAVSLLPMPALAAEGTDDLTKIAGGGDFTLTADTTLTQPLEIKGNVTLDLGGHTVNFSPANTEGTNLSAIIISSGSLTLKGKGTISVPDAATAVSLAGSDTALTVHHRRRSRRKDQHRNGRRQNRREHDRQDLRRVRHSSLG